MLLLMNSGHIVRCSLADWVIRSESNYCWRRRATPLYLSIYQKRLAPMRLRKARVIWKKSENVTSMMRCTRPSIHENCEAAYTGMWAETGLCYFLPSHETSHTEFMNRHLQQMKDFTLVAKTHIPNYPPVAPEMALTWPSSPLFDVGFHCCYHHRSGRNMSRIDFFVLNY